MSDKKVCSKCKRELSVSNFRWKNKSKGIYHSQCKDCQKAQEKIHYQESKERRESVRETATFQKNRNILLVEQARQCGCIKCGEKRSYVLDFHHRDPEEKADVLSHMIKSASESSILKELAKCDVLCANCHREFHYLEKEYGISYDEYLSYMPG
jgi:hypothetical protein